MAALIHEDGTDDSANIVQEITLQDLDGYMINYIGHSNSVVLILDYDGTLAPISSHPDLAILPLETKTILERLNKMPNVGISIISKRNARNLKKMVGINGLTYLGNDGLEVLYPKGTFMQSMPKEYEEKFKSLLKLLQDQVCKYGAWAELKGFLLTFNYRKVPVGARPELLSTAERMIEEAGFNARQADCAIEVIAPKYWDKGCGALGFLRTACGQNWSMHICTIYAGDDFSDEYAFHALRGKAATFKVTESPTANTSAEYRLPSIDSVVTLLRWVEQYFGTPIPR